MTNPISTSITLGGFVDFITANASRRVTAVCDVAEMQLSDYERSHDFYAGVRDAITLGVANSDDEERMRHAAEDCNPRRREHYEAVAHGWASWRRGKTLRVFSQPLGWHEQGLAVRVSPKFTWHERRQSHMVWPYFKADELTGDATQAAVRIMELLYPPSFGRPAVLDVRRGRLYHRRGRSKNIDAWLAGEASAFLTILASINAA
ncbi:hypothetical protein ACQI4F_05800 [Mycolicibacterium vaccae]|uniref:hypothetical protein n=1 Tax=Mycolicibacterium vaccae TaxID=1810 RepID=UPI003CF4337B